MGLPSMHAFSSHGESAREQMRGKKKYSHFMWRSNFKLEDCYIKKSCILCASFSPSWLFMHIYKKNIPFFFFNLFALLTHLSIHVIRRTHPFRVKSSNKSWHLSSRQANNHCFTGCDFSSKSIFFKHSSIENINYGQQAVQVAINSWTYSGTYAPLRTP
jgi:hypothetical protein